MERSSVISQSVIIYVYINYSFLRIIKIIFRFVWISSFHEHIIRTILIYSFETLFRERNSSTIKALMKVQWGKFYYWSCFQRLPFAFLSCSPADKTDGHGRTGKSQATKISKRKDFSIVSALLSLFLSEAISLFLFQFLTNVIASETRTIRCDLINSRRWSQEGTLHQGISIPGAYIYERQFYVAENIKQRRKSRLFDALIFRVVLGNKFEERFEKFM